MNQGKPNRVSWFLFIALLLVGGILRIWNLGAKPFMHDESLFAYYSYCVWPLFNYRYDPLLHGPFLLHLTAGLFRLFGDNDFTARFWSACFATGCILLFWLFRRKIGVVGAIAAVAMFAFSPTLLYYSRFLRNDMLLLFWALALILSYLYWIENKRSSLSAFLLVLSAGLMVCIMENAVFVFFTGLTYLLFVLFLDLIHGLINRIRAGAFSLQRLRPESDSPLRFIQVAIGNCIAWIIFVYVGKRLFIDPKTGVSFTAFTRNQAATFVLIGLLFSQIVSWLIVQDRRYSLGARRWGGIFGNQVFTTWMSLASGLLVAMSVYAALFTTWFKFEWGFFQIYRETLEYWWGQHKEHRLKGPFHYYMFRLLVYETLPLTLAILGALSTIFRRLRFLVIYAIGVATIFGLTHLALHSFPFNKEWADQHLHMTSPWHLYAAFFLGWTAISLSGAAILQGRVFHGFLIWWTIFSLLEYSYAGEKVPWLGVHIVTPLLLLAASEFNQFFAWLKSSRRFLVMRYAMVGSISLLAAALFVRHLTVALQVSFQRPTDPEEMMVYNHTQPEFLRIVETVQTLAKTSGEGYKLPMTITGEASWPLNWYLRRYERYLQPQNLATTRDAIIVVNEGELQKVPRIFAPEYRIETIPLRQAWVPKELNVQAMWKTVLNKMRVDKLLKSEPTSRAVLDAGAEDWKKFWTYFWTRKAWPDETLKRGKISLSYDVIFLTRKDYLNQTAAGTAQ